MTGTIRLLSYKRKSVRISLHLLFWLFVTIMYTVTYNRIDKTNSWVMVTKDLFAVTTIFYSTAYIIIPKWLMREKYILPFLWVVVIYLWWGLITYLTCVFIRGYLEPGPRMESFVKVVLERGLIGFFNLTGLPFYLLDFVYLVSLPLGLKVMQAFVRVRYQKTVLERDNLALELAFLKSQINPHFLFNTLNNIYTLVTAGRGGGAESIAMLSSIMNYILHESNKPFVSLNSELDFLKDYFELERLRFDEKVEISITIEEDSDRYIIVPLILLPFIENAYKHGPKASSRRNAWINLLIRVEDGMLMMEISNGVNRTPKPVDYIGGIGIANVRKRLELNYPNRYDLKIDEQQDSYEVLLRLVLEDDELEPHYGDKREEA